MTADFKTRMHWYKVRISRLIHQVLLWIDNRTQKTKTIWAFPVCYLNHRLFDNARPVFEALKSNPDVTKVVLYRGKPPQALNNLKFKGQRVHLARLYSPLGLWWLFHAQVIFVRHCVAQDIGFSLNNSKRLVVNLFHGIALKKIGTQTSKDSITGCDPFGAIISSSVADSQTMLTSFKFANSDNVWITGLPRNDVLLMPEENLWQEAKDELRRVKERLSGRKLILFAPTFRAGWERWEDKAGFYKFSSDQLSRLESIAKQAGAVIGIRTHIREERSVLKAFEGLDLLVFNDIVEPALVLRMTDVLISDYSSIAIDFLLMRRPALSFAFDYKTYKKGKGFLYDLEKVFPSPLCFSFDDLESALISALNSNTTEKSERYRYALELFHRYPDDQSTKRVIAEIGKNLGLSELI